MKIRPVVSKSVSTVLLLAFIVIFASGCVVVRHSDLDNAGAQGGQYDDVKYSASAYRDENWEKVVENIINRSSDANAVLQALTEDVDVAGEKYGRRAQQAGSAWNFGISGTAKIVSVNTELRAGTVGMDLEPFDGVPDFIMQVGPVFRTNCLRDFTDFIRFDDFSNQVEYANLTGAFNETVYESVLNIAESWQEGDIYEFVGAFTWQNSNEPDMIQMIPVKLEKAGD